MRALDFRIDVSRVFHIRVRDRAHKSIWISNNRQCFIKLATPIFKSDKFFVIKLQRLSSLIRYDIKVTVTIAFQQKSITSNVINCGI